MIQVNILRDRNEVVKGIDINGHAGYAEYGQDVICAAVSALVLNMANSVETFTDDHFEGSVGEDGGSFSFSFPDAKSRRRSSACAAMPERQEKPRKFGSSVIRMPPVP